MLILYKSLTNENNQFRSLHKLIRNCKFERGMSRQPINTDISKYFATVTLSPGNQLIANNRQYAAVTFSILFLSVSTTKAIMIFDANSQKFYQIRCQFLLLETDDLQYYVHYIHKDMLFGNHMQNQGQKFNSN